ncbi:GIY-YIG nuclease family protein [Nocardioides sp. T5]|uniref:GIY-YIG nuclease family protein n=1 Tax=Nocardioides sp. T5 TaxID=3400182 RepID=UPI003A8AF065
MLTFNDLLALEHVDVARVRLVRHQDRRLAPGRLYEAWRNDRASFDSYQAVQARDVFRVGDLLASFIVTEAGKTVFVGMYSVDGVGTCPEGAVDALLTHDISGQVAYQLQHGDHLVDYVDRVVIDWGAGTRSWVQRAANQPKPVVEIAEQYEPKFPGFRIFTRLVDDIPALPAGWQQVLRSVKGVYLLVDVESGHQYVGSAKGADSLFGRWMDYAADGHGGDVALKAAAAAGGRRSYQVSVLEVVDANVPDETIEQIESYWKTKLLTRTFGLNRN